jgi:hypothetical protein
MWLGLPLLDVILVANGTELRPFAFDGQAPQIVAYLLTVTAEGQLLKVTIQTPLSDTDFRVAFDALTDVTYSVEHSEAVFTRDQDGGYQWTLPRCP